jgi:hypothetical protein
MNEQLSANRAALLKRQFVQLGASVSLGGVRQRRRPLVGGKMRFSIICLMHTTISKAAGAILVAGALSAPDPAAAASFPAPLLGKSVSVNWTDNRQVKLEGTGEIRPGSWRASLQVYISTAGRAFSRESWSGGGGGMWRRGGRGRGFGTSFQEEQAPGDPATSLGSSKEVVHMEGGALVVDRKMREGARRVVVTFDAGYTSCNARVILGREGGTSALRSWNPVTRRRFEIVSINIATPSCAVAPGNMFGGE